MPITDPFENLASPSTAAFQTDDAGDAKPNPPEPCFEMRNASGDRRVRKLVERVLAKPRDRREIVIMLRTGLLSIERHSPEVRNDSVRESICRALDEFCDRAGMERINCSEF